jgi:hypothetical protein
MRKLAIAMPVEGPPETARVHYGPQLALRRLANVVRLDEVDASWGPTLTGNVDISRARDRMARLFLYNLQDCTDLLWWDEDVLPDDLGVIERLLVSGHDMVGVPYRRKQAKEVYPYRLCGPDGQKKRVDVVNGCVQVDSLAFGFMLTSRACLQRMWNAYFESRWYVDVSELGAHETVGMFDLIYSPKETAPDGGDFRVKLSEDYSFCESWKALGGTVQMYVGPGAPVGHIGEQVFRGTPEGLANAS